MTPEELQTFELMQKEIDNERIRRLDMENKYSQLSSIPNPVEKNIMEIQIDLDKELDRIYHLLSGHQLKIVDQNEIWVEADDDRLKILSEYGVKQIMNLISFHVNKDILLSNFDEKTIIWKVKDFGIELADLVYNRYEHFFFYPSPEELYERYSPLINEGTYNFTEKELYEKCFYWSNEELKTKLRHYPIIIQSIIDIVHATYLRALNGGERTSLRKQWNIHENISPMYNPMNPTKSSIFKPATWTK